MTLGLKAYRIMMSHLTRKTPDKKISDLINTGKLKTADEVSQPPIRQDVEQTEAFNEFNKRNPKADGGRMGYYPGGSVEQFGKQIKDGYLKGKSITKINEELFPGVNKTTTIDSFIDSSKKGLGPIKITEKELATRPVVKQGRGQAGEAQKRLKTFIETFEKDKGRLPSSQELRKLGNFDFYTIKNAVDAGDVNILDATTAARIAQQESQGVNRQLLELSKDKDINNIFKSGKTTIGDIKKVKKVIGNVSNSQAATRLLQLASIYGEKGIEEDRGLNIKPKFKKNALKILESSPYTGYIRNMNEALIGKSVGEPSIKGAKSKIVQDPNYIKTNVAKLFDIDEPQGVASSVNRGSTPYGIFGQIIDANKNKIKVGWDGTKSKLEENVQKTISQFGVNSKEAKLAKDKYNSAATKVENNLNQGRLRGAKKITIPKMSFDAPKNTITNYKNFNTTYKKAFDDVFATQKYSFVIPKDLRTIPQLRKEVINPNSSTYKQMINTLKKGFNEFDEKKLFDKINNATPDSFKKILRKIPRIASLNDDFTGAGGFPLTAGLDSSIGVRPVKEEKNFIQRNPFTTAAGTAAAAATTKTGRNILKRLATGAFTPTGVALQTAGLGELDLTTPAGRLSLGAEAAFAPELVKASIGATRGMKNRALQKGIQQALNLGLPTKLALRAARIASPLGIASLGAEGLYQAGKYTKKRIGELKAMSPEQRQQLRAQQEALAFEGAKDGGLIGDKSGPPPEKGPNSQGLPSLIKRVKKL